MLHKRGQYAGHETARSGSIFRAKAQKLMDGTGWEHLIRECQFHRTKPYTPGFAGLRRAKALPQQNILLQPADDVRFKLRHIFRVFRAVNLC